MSRINFVLVLIMSACILLLVAVAVFSGLRAYAMSGRNMWILVVSLASGILNPCINVVVFVVFYQAYLTVWTHPIARPGPESFIVYEK
ncbi:hypothetical protein C8Q78DRAFT_1079946 [Trametes maxima]|nr:hypothetical protein C8Q78DRAFT_1079946 [Trametes maxima]